MANLPPTSCSTTLPAYTGDYFDPPVLDGEQRETGTRLEAELVRTPAKTHCRGLVSALDGNVGFVPFARRA
jgi:hypothetical protein